jgi:16S rRNA (adenine1518-N6/adenine1519-N6)-dimethyltransferase
MLASPATLRALLARHEIRLERRLGQHFLADSNILRKIAEGARLSRADAVFEIGPGAGALTVELAQRAGRVVAIEVDPRLVEVLRETVGAMPNVTVVTGDVLAADLRALLSFRTVRPVLQDRSNRPARRRRWKAVANLPYAITSPAIARLIEHRDLFCSMVLMVQREVADRLMAQPGGKEYGALTVLAQTYCAVERVLQVSRACFFPPPQVDSTVVRFVMRRRPLVPPDLEGVYFAVVRAAFGYRRKTLANALAAGLGLDKVQTQALIRQAGLDPGQRGESLSLREFVRLARAGR